MPEWENSLPATEVSWWDNWWESLKAPEAVAAEEEYETAEKEYLLAMEGLNNDITNELSGLNYLAQQQSEDPDNLEKHHSMA